MKKPASAPRFDIYFRASYQKARKRSGVHKKHPIGARSARRRHLAPIRISEIKDDEMTEPPVTPKDERKIWD